MMEIGGVLRDVPVLVADDYPFRRDYVLQVLKLSGAKVVGPFDDRESVLAFLAAGEAPRLAYIAGGISDDAHGLIAALAKFGVRCVAICSNVFGSNLPPGTRTLRSPLSAFQVIEALVQLHHECGSEEAAASSPQPPPV